MLCQRSSIRFCIWFWLKTLIVLNFCADEIVLLKGFWTCFLRYDQAISAYISLRIHYYKLFSAYQILNTKTIVLVMRKWGTEGETERCYTVKKVFFFQNVFSDFCGSSKSWKNILSLGFSFSKNNLFCKYFSIILPNLQEYIIWGNKFHWLLQGQIWKVGHVFVRRRWQNILGQLMDFDR